MGIKSEVEQALDSHAAWRKGFKEFLAGREAFDVAIVGVTDQCAFGQWLGKEGYRLIPTQLHIDICAAHLTFHQVAAEIMQLIKVKQFAEAREAVSSGGKLDKASERLAELLKKATLRDPVSKSASAQNNRGG